MFYLPFETDTLCTNSENRMNGREMPKQISGKQTNAQTQARPPNNQMVDCPGRRFAQVEKAVWAKISSLIDVNFGNVD